MKDENSVPAAQKMTDVSLSIFRSKFKKTRIQMIDYNDAGGHGTLVGSKVQKFDPSTRNWEDVFKIDKSEFCRPYPLGMIETQIITKRLWPGQSISSGEEATAARDVFSIGDKARIVAFARDGLTFHTAAFSIDEHPSRPGVPYRARH